MMLLLKASLVLICLLAFYKLFLEKESFFSANRIYLLGCLALAFLLPFVMMPKLIDQQGCFHDLLENPTINQQALNINITQPASQANPSIHEPDIIVEKASKKDHSELELLTQSENFDEPLTAYTLNAVTQNKRDLSFWMLWVYLFGVGVLAVNLIAQITALFLKVRRNKDKIHDDGSIIVNLKGDIAPCSFFNYIFINPANYDYATYEQIIDHEKIHVHKGHSWDLLLAELAVVILWFNPFTWLLRREVEKNLEYQTDDLLTKNETEAKQNYQLQLLEIACPTSPLTITTNYNQSLIRQRILKMNTKKSNNFQYWKYAFSIPLLFILLLLLNRPSTSYASAEIPANQNYEEVYDGELDIIAEDEIPAEQNTHAAKSPENISNAEKEEVNKAIFSDAAIPKIISSNCAEFEQAVADGDLVKVKEILKSLHPDCLKLNQNDTGKLKSVKNLVMDMQMNLDTPKEDIKVDETICEKVRMAVEAGNKNELRRLLEAEDISCLNDNSDEPNSTLHFIKGLLSYDVDLDIDYNGVINISQIGFRIKAPSPLNAYCQDPNYLSLLDAIKNKDDSRIRKILSTQSLSCPLSTDGERNDFIFIKALMKYNPRITNYNGKSIKVHGVGIRIDLDGKGNSPQRDPSYNNISVVTEKNEKKAVLDDPQKVLNDFPTIKNRPKSNKDNRNWNCTDLVEAVQNADFDEVFEQLQFLDPNCFQRETTTITNNGKSRISTAVTTPLIAAARDGNLDFIIHLIEHQANVNYRVDEDETALMAAVKAGNVLVVKALLRHGANVNWTDLNNMTALDYAKRDKHFTLIKYLESKGAKPNKYSANKDADLKKNKCKEHSKLKSRALWKHLC